MKTMFAAFVFMALIPAVAAMLAFRVETSPAAAFAAVGLCVIGLPLWVYTARRWRRYE